MEVTQERYNYSFNRGRIIEDKFSSLMKSRNNKVLKSNTSDDIHKHIDFWVNNIGIDVKGYRHLDCIWLELTNVRGNKGWLKGEAEYIVFDVVELNSFCFYKREDLLNFVLINVKEKTIDKKDFMKFYSRSIWGKKDVLVKCKYKDIKHLEIQKIEY